MAGMDGVMDTTISVSFDTIVGMMGDEGKKESSGGEARGENGG